MFNFLIIFGAKYLYLAVIIIAVFYFFRQTREKQKEIAIFGAIVLPLSYILAKVAGLFYYDPRPFVQSGIAPLVPHIADNGFPSDHTLICAAIASTIFVFNKKIGILLGIIAILVGTARVLAGVHHSIDIIGSIIVSVFIAFVANKFIMPNIRHRIFKNN